MSNEALREIFYQQVQGEPYNKVVINKFSGEYKRVYRLLLVHYFASSFVSNEEEFNWSQYQISRMYAAVRGNLFQLLEEDFLDEVKKKSLEYLCKELKFKFVSNLEGPIKSSEVKDSLLNEFVNILLTYKVDFKKTLYEYKDLEEYWDIQSLYKARKHDSIILSYHWIELKPFQINIPVHTFPEFFAYQDMLNSWNDLVEKYKFINENTSINDREVREVHHSYNSSLRTTMTLGVHFFETYLYYLYFNIKSNGQYPGNKLIKRNDIRKINDKQILKDLVFKEFTGIGQTTATHYDKYLETLEYRDAFVHMSAFSENGLSRMQYLLNLHFSMVCESLQNIVDFIEIIEKSIGQEQILFWKEKFDWPEFLKHEKISNLIKLKV